PTRCRTKPFPRLGVRTRRTLSRRPFRHPFPTLLLPSRPPRGYAVASLLLALVALPLAVAVGVYWLGVVLASVGVGLAAFAFLLGLKRRSSGVGLTTIALAVCGSMLLATLILAIGVPKPHPKPEESVGEPGQQPANKPGGTLSPQFSVPNPHKKPEESVGE